MVGLKKKSDSSIDNTGSKSIKNIFRKWFNREKSLAEEIANNRQLPPLDSLTKVWYRTFRQPLSIDKIFSYLENVERVAIYTYNERTNKIKCENEIRWVPERKDTKILESNIEFSINEDNYISRSIKKDSNGVYHGYYIDNAERIEIEFNLVPNDFTLSWKPHENDDKGNKMMFVIPLLAEKDDAIGSFVIEGRNLRIKNGEEKDKSPMKIFTDTVAYLVTICAVYAEWMNSRIDIHTGLRQKRAFGEWLERLSKEYIETGKNFWLILIDLDYLKSINDGRGGHNAGDEALKYLAEVLVQFNSFRLGGDEFAVLVDNADRNAAEEVAKRIVKEVATRQLSAKDKNTGEEFTFNISCSIGIADAMSTRAITGQKNNYELFITELRRITDAALYYAKNNGKNRAVEVVIETEPSDPSAIRTIYKEC